MIDARQPRRPRRFARVLLPSIQLRIAVAVFLSCVGTAVLQYLLMMRGMTGLAARHQGLPSSLKEDAVGELLRAVGTSLGIVLPLAFLVGVRVSSTFSGPLYRMTKFLREVIDGGAPADVQLRTGDQLQEFSELLNQATAAQRERNEPSAPVERDAA